MTKVIELETRETYRKEEEIIESVVFCCTC